MTSVLWVLLWTFFVVDILAVFAIVRSIILKSKVRDIWKSCAPTDVRAYYGALRACAREVLRYLLYDAPGEQLVLTATVIPILGEVLWVSFYLIGYGLDFWIWVVCSLIARFILAVYFLNGRLTRFLYEHVWIRLQPPSLLD